MKDMLDILYSQLLENQTILEKVTANRISYYEYPETKDDSKPFMIIIPMHPPRPGNSGSNIELSTIHTFQIDVQGSNRKEVKLIQKEVKSTMFSLGFVQLPEGLDEYLNDVKRYVDARRYRVNTKLYDTDY